MMSDATEYALFRLTKGDKTAATKRLEALEESKQVKEYMELKEALAERDPSASNTDEPKS